MDCKKAKSKGVLWATNGCLPINLNKSSTILLSAGASATILLVIPVISSMKDGIGIPGLTREVNRFDGSPSINKIAATSIIRSVST